MNLDHFKLQSLHKPIVDLKQVQPLISIPHLDSMTSIGCDKTYKNAENEL